MPGMDLPIPDGLPPWLAAFVAEAQRETDTLRDNGAEQAAAARTALLKKLVASAQSATGPSRIAAPTQKAATVSAAATSRSLPRLPPARMIPVPMPRTSPDS